MKNVIIETAQKRFQEFLRTNSEAFEMAITGSIYIMVINTDTYNSIFRELNIHERADAKESVKNLLMKRIETDEEVLHLLRTEEKICFSKHLKGTLAIRALNCYVAISGFSTEMNHKFLTEILMENRQLTEEMRVENHRALIKQLENEYALQVFYPASETN